MLVVGFDLLTQPEPPFINRETFIQRVISRLVDLNHAQPFLCPLSDIPIEITGTLFNKRRNLIIRLALSYAKNLHV